MIPRFIKLPLKTISNINGYNPKIGELLDRKFWIFDLDGTLTVAVHDFPAIREELGIPANADILKFIQSQDQSTADRMLAKLDGIEIDLANQSRPAEGAVELVTELKKTSAQLGIITRNTRENAKISLDKIGILDQFEDICILGRQEAPPKPDPSSINQLLTYWKISSEQAVMVGDYLFDLQTGKAVGAATIHVSTNMDAVWPELTDIHVPSLTQLVQMLIWKTTSAPFEN